jgi:hypothetical protein
LVTADLICLVFVQKISAAAKARWAKIKSAGKKLLKDA